MSDTNRRGSSRLFQRLQMRAGNIAHRSRSAAAHGAIRAIWAPAWPMKAVADPNVIDCAGAPRSTATASRKKASRDLAASPLIRLRRTRKMLFRGRPMAQPRPRLHAGLPARSRSHRPSHKSDSALHELFQRRFRIGVLQKRADGSFAHAPPEHVEIALEPDRDAARSRSAPGSRRS